MAQNRSIKMLSFSQQWGLQRTLSKKTEKNKILTNVFLQDVCLSFSFKKKITKNQQKIQSLR